MVKIIYNLSTVKLALGPAMASTVADLHCYCLSILNSKWISHSYMSDERDNLHIRPSTALITETHVMMV